MKTPKSTFLMLLLISVLVVGMTGITPDNHAIANSAKGGGTKVNVELPAPQIFNKEVTLDDKTMKYVVQMPRVHKFKLKDAVKGKAKEAWPVVINLHGSGGESYVDRIMNGEVTNVILEHTSPSYEFPAILIYPRKPSGSWQDNASLVKEALDEVIRSYNVDENRIYLMGFSLGGRGVWEVALEYPERFAGLVVSNGISVPEDADLMPLRYTPVWVFHGRNDFVVPISNSETMVDRLLGIGNNKVSYTVYPGGHRLLGETLSEATYRWLLKQNKEEQIAEKEEREDALANNIHGKAARGTPAIDGKMDAAWAAASWLRTGKVVTADNYTPATARFKTMWDDDYLYVYAIVTDPVLSAVHNASHEQDSIEFFLDPRNFKIQDYDIYTSQYRVNIDNRHSFGPNANRDDFHTAIIPNGAGYIVEAAIPWPDLYKPHVKEGLTIGFDLAVNDDNGAGKRTGVKAWSDTTGQGWQWSNVFGNLTLAPGAAAKAPSESPE